MKIPTKHPHRFGGNNALKQLDLCLIRSDERNHSVILYSQNVNGYSMMGDGHLNVFLFTGERDGNRDRNGVVLLNISFP